MRATNRIQKSTVDAMRPSGKRETFLWDAELKGFGVKMMPSGRKSYVLAYRTGGRATNTQRYTIGQHGPWTPDKARAEATRIKRMVDLGEDPREAERQRKRAAEELGFADYIGVFTEKCLKLRWRAWKTSSRQLELHVVPILGKKPLPSITKADLANVLERLADRPALARRVAAMLSRLFSFALSRDDIERSPMVGLEKPKPTASRERVLSDDELAQVWKASSTLNQPYGPLVRLLILTGQRLREVANMRWEEIDLADRTWTLPAHRAKNKRTHIMPLCDMALAEIAACGPQRQGFVLTYDGRAAPSAFSQARKRLDAAINAARADGQLDVQPVADWHFHDLRRTLATGLQRLDVRLEVTEAILNHVSGSRSGVIGIYQRYHWKGEKREALVAWERHVLGLMASRP